MTTTCRRADRTLTTSLRTGANQPEATPRTAKTMIVTRPRGVPGEELKPTRCPSRQRRSPELLARVRDWVEREIAFVDHPLFHEGNSTARLAALRPASLDQTQHATKLEPGLAFVSAMVEMPLLSIEEEVYLFSRMNFLKWHAEQNRRRLSLNRPDEALVERIESGLREANDVRNQIVRSNLRLVVALSKKLSGVKQPGAIDQMSELISEGTLPLIRSVELFDISLGNRFSTYATWAVRNQMFRFLKRRQSRFDSAVGEDDRWTSRLVDNRVYPEDDERQAAHHVDAVQRLLSQLSERERFVVAARFGLDGQPQGQSLHDIATLMGLSKERVRQIVIASLEKLQGFAQVSGIE